MPDDTERFFAACAANDLAAVREMLAARPDLVHAREKGDNATALHFAGSKGTPLVRMLLDAGADPNAEGDAHELGVIGWATCFPREIPWDVVNLLVERGAKHHIFSAIAVADRDLIRRIVAENPKALERRLSKHEGRQTPLHYVVAPPDGLIGGGFRTGGHYDMIDLLVELGADVEATDAKGRTPLTAAMLHGDTEAMRRLRAAGAKVPEPSSTVPFAERVAPSRKNVDRIDVMLKVRDINRSMAWYQSIGFELQGTYGDDGELNWAGLSFGKAFFMLIPGELSGDHRDVSFWIQMTNVDELYAAFRDRQLAAARDGGTAVRLSADLHDAFYGNREFTIEDPDGYSITFAQATDSAGD